MLKLVSGARNRRRRAGKRQVGRGGDLRVLNVRVESKRSRQVRRTRTLRRGGRLLLLAGGVLVVAFSVKSVVDRVYYENPTFELGKLFIETDGALTRTAILRESGIHREDHLLEIDLDLVRARIKAMPQVDDVRVERQLPDIVSIQVWEREPVAWLECPPAGAIPHSPDEGWFIDAHGRIFPCGGLADEHLDLPIIVADDLPPLIGKVEVNSGHIMDAVRLIDLNGKRLFDEQLEIDRIECARDYSLIVTYRNDAAVVFETRDLEGQFDDFAAILAFVKAEGLQIATLNLMVAENKPITYYHGPTSWEEVPILRASASLPLLQDEAAVAADEAAVWEEREEDGRIDTAESAPALVPAETQVVSESSSAGPGRDRGSDVRAIMGSLYD